jgi:photosystem II stability/assembly factor-like uncharacterized protein
VAKLRDALGWSLPYSPAAGCIRGLAFHGEQGYAAAEVGGVLLSGDGGERWRMSKGSPEQTFPLASGAVHPDVHSIEVHSVHSVHPGSPVLVYAPTGGGFYRSMDGGESWDLRYRCYCRAAWVDPDNPEHILLGPADGVDVNGRIEATRNGGRTWVSASDGLETPWRRHMVERFARAGDTLLAVLSNGELLAAPISALAWRRILPEAGKVNAVASLD